MKTTLNLLALVAVVAGPCACLTGCGTAKVSARRETAAPPPAPPMVVYVADFDLNAAEIKSEPGLLPPPPKLPAQLSGRLPVFPSASKNPENVARQLVDSMSVSIVSELTKAGFTARRIFDSCNLPTSGWLVRGVFTEVDQGNQLQRAVVGFGWGKTDLQLSIKFDYLTQGPPKHFYELNTAAESGKAPGAGPTILLGPAGVTARFTIAGQDLNRNVKQTASKIAEELARQTKGI